MQSADEAGRGGNDKPPFGEPKAHVGVIEQPRQQARIHVAGISAACAAVQAAGMRVVCHARAVADEQNQRGEVARQRHCAQDRLGRGNPISGRKRRIEARGRFDAARPVAQSKCVADQLGDVHRSRRFDEGERRYGGKFESPPGTCGARPGPIVKLACFFPGATRSGRNGGRQQHRKMLLDNVGSEPPMRRTKSEETRESQRADGWIGNFQRAAKPFRTDIDAEGGLPLCRGRCLRSGLVAERCAEPPLPANFSGILQQRVQAIGLARRNRLVVVLPRGDPMIFKGVRETLEKRYLPHHANDQKFELGAIAGTSKFGLPPSLARKLGPPAERDQQPVTIGRKPCLPDTEPSRGQVERGASLVGKIGDEAGKSSQAENFRREVVLRLFPPRGIGPARPGEWPHCLAFIEEGACPRSHAILDDPGPICLQDQRGKIGNGGEGDGRVSIDRR